MQLLLEKNVDEWTERLFMSDTYTVLLPSSDALKNSHITGSYDKSSLMLFTSLKLSVIAASLFIYFVVVVYFCCVCCYRSSPLGKDPTLYLHGWKACLRLLVTSLRQSTSRLNFSSIA